MAKYEDNEVNKRNIPNLELYTKQIGLAYGSAALNCFLIYLYLKFFVKWEQSKFVLVLSILLLWVIRIRTTDWRKSERGLGAVLGDWLVCSVLTMTVVIVGELYWLLGIFVIEIVIAIVITNRYFKNH